MNKIVKAATIAIDIAIMVVGAVMIAESPEVSPLWFGLFALIVGLERMVEDIDAVLKSGHEKR